MKLLFILALSLNTIALADCKNLIDEVAISAQSHGKYLADVENELHKLDKTLELTNNRKMKKQLKAEIFLLETDISLSENNVSNAVLRAKIDCANL
jgi:hypothetical protein